MIEGKVTLSFVHSKLKTIFVGVIEVIGKQIPKSFVSGAVNSEFLD